MTSRKRSKIHPAARLPRADRRMQEHDRDTYGMTAKLPDPTGCPSCGATFHEGRWTWRPAPAEAHRAHCPACKRIEDGYPAGIVTLEGEFQREHRQEIEGLARNLEEREKADHPLKRIMRMEESEDGSLEIATTDIHLARGIGSALHDAYEGEVDYGFTDVENLFRVHWKR
jgi:NMD protein affecting ribosome stability and mRNA decay